MKSSRTTFSLLLFIFITGAVIMGSIYTMGRFRKPVRFHIIPENVTGWISSLDSLGSDGGFVNVGVRPLDWDNDDDYGVEDGWLSISDANFIVYYRNHQDSLWIRRAEMTLSAAGRNIDDLTYLMGRYPYPSSSYGRKLPIYLPDSGQDYANTVDVLLGRHDPDASNSSGMHISCVGVHGYMAIGIILQPFVFEPDVHPKYTYEYVLRHEMNHFVFFSLLDYSCDIEHRMWEYEGLADFFAYKYGELTPQVAGRDSIEFIRTRCDLKTDFPMGTSRMANAPYWAGESFYIMVKDSCGFDNASLLVRSLYSHSFDNAVSSFFPDSVDVHDFWVESLLANAEKVEEEQLLDK